MTVGVWEWKADDYTFHPFHAKENAALEKAWAAGETSTQLTLGSQKYTLSFDDMTQTNNKTNKERLIRRKGPKGGLISRAPVWEWEVSKGVFKRYDTETSDTIEAAFLRDDLQTKVKLGTGAHDTVEMVIHFGHMHQQNTDKKGGVRRIRRVTATLAVPDKPTREATMKVATEVVADEPPLKAPRKAAAALAAMDVIAAKPWVRDDSLLVLDAGGRQYDKVIAFDMDDTLVTPKSGKVFSTGPSDWKWLHPSVPEKLRSLYDGGFRILIMSNQSGIGGKGWDEAKAKVVTTKLDGLMKEAGVPVSGLFATEDNKYRKPSPLMWDYFVQNLHKGDGTPTLVKYVGDAAGRSITTLAGRKKDFSCSDRKLAYNLGVEFATPEAYFTGAAEAPFDWDGIAPAELAKIFAQRPPVVDYHKKTQELVIMVGYPGSGKSSFAKKYLVANGYAHVNRDTLKKWQVCVSTTDSLLKAGRSVVVDNTSPTREERGRYIALAKAQKVPIRVFLMSASIAFAKHMNTIRGMTGGERVSGMVFNMYKSKFEEPNPAKEGFDEVVEIPFLPDFTKATEKVFKSLS